MNQSTATHETLGIDRSAWSEPVQVDRVARFVEYAMAFEQVLVTGDWQQLEAYFTPDAVRHVVGGGPLSDHSSGRDAVIADLRSSVESCDFRFDRRLPEIVSGPTERDGVVWIDWRLNLQREGLPDLVVDGTHGTHFEGDRICRIEEAVNNENTARVEAYLAEHAARLRPGPVRPRGVVAPRMSHARMRELVEGYAAAKSSADVDGALALCNDSFVIDTVSFGIASRDRAETTLHLHAFFQAFPDYNVTVGGTLYGKGGAACWGTCSMTLRGDLLGVAATHRRAEVPFVSWFTFADNLLASEKFYFDLATLCDGIGVSLPQMQAALAAFRTADSTIVAGG